MKYFQKKYLLIIFLAGLFIPAVSVQAESWIIDKIALPAVTSLFSYSLFIVFYGLGNIMSFLVTLLDWTVNIRIYTNVPVIQEGWKIMRDFANMLFIIALIVMAYGTIFNIPKYDFRSLLPRFIVIALLINFSLVLCGLLIDATQVLNNTFLNAMGDISGKLGQGLSVTSLLPDTKNIGETGEALTNLSFSVLINLAFGIFMAFTIVISVAAPLAIAFVRIPVLWALLIVSPMALLLSILPATRQAYEKWWQQFLAWNLFLPYYLFVLYFALFFLSKQPQVIAGLGQTFVNDSMTGLGGLGGNFTFNLIFTYMMVAIFLIGGTKAAMNAGRFSGTGIVSAAKWGRGVAMRKLRVTAAERAASQKLDEIKKEGLPGRFGVLYGGERALEEQTARMARRFGVRGASYDLQKKFIDNTDKEFKLLEQQYETGKINPDQIESVANQMKATDPKGFAYRTLAAKLGRIDSNMMHETMSDLQNNPLAVQHFIKTAKDAKFSNLKPNELLEAATGEGRFSDIANIGELLPARREIFRYIQNDPLIISRMNEDQFKKGLGGLGGHTTAEGKEFIKNIGKARPDFAIRYNRTNGLLIPRPDGSLPTDRDLYEGYLKDIKDIAAMPMDVWNEKDFRRALFKRMRSGTPKANRNFADRLSNELRFAFGSERKQEILLRLIKYSGINPPNRRRGNNP